MLVSYLLQYIALVSYTIILVSDYYHPIYTGIANVRNKQITYLQKIAKMLSY